MNREYLKGFYEARNTLWELKLAQLASLDPYLKRINGIKAFNKEFRTLHLDYGRQTGNTTWLRTKCYELAIVRQKSCFCFFINLDMANRFWGLMENFAGEKINKKSSNVYMHTFETMRKGWQHIPNSYAFVDISCMLGNEKLDRIMESDQWEIICLL
jgi:hypothetical protein